MRQHGKRRGIALIEVIVALSLMVLLSESVIGLILQGEHALRIARLEEQKIERATEIMTRISAWRREQLLSATGLSQVGGLVIRVEQVGLTQFHVLVGDAAGPAVLESDFYRAANAP